LTAYHEQTHQKRAVINLSKASRLVDDKRTLVADPASPTKSKGRRKSAFGEEDEGYAYVEEGFRIRFANGETIDFYADNRGLKEQWIVALSQVIGKPDFGGDKKAAWTDLVLARERAQAGQPQSAPGSSDGSSSPVKAGGVEVRDFTKPPPAAPPRQSSYRKPVGTPASKSAPNSPMKSQATRNAPFLPTAAPAGRPKTPPLQPRKGHRSRNAVKSMIF
jgi:hypothetical protein